MRGGKISRKIDTFPALYLFIVYRLRGLVPFLLLSFITACATNPKIDTFILPNDTQQHFIRPFVLKNDSLYAEMDITVRTQKELISKVVINFSISGGDEAIQRLEEAQFVLENNSIIALTAVEPLFIDRNNRLARYTSQLSPDNFKTLIVQKKVQFKTIQRGTPYVFIPQSSYYAQIEGAKRQFIY